MTLSRRIQQSRFESPSQRAMLSLLVVAGAVSQRLADACARHGITLDQYNVLRILRGVYPDGHPRYEIVDRLINRAPDVTRLLDRLQRQGLVERARAEQDRRLSISRITQAGLELLREMQPEVEALHAEFGARLQPAELEELARLCDALIPD
jgi:DNA-binding MarR family transcriptional regulator